MTVSNPQGAQGSPRAKPVAGFLAAVAVHPRAWLLALIFSAALCAVGNLPWHLDNYDQAKQAFVAYEIAHGGDVFFQHTPRGRIATKPPLAGWISLPVFYATGSWDLAWRLPGYLAFLALALLVAAAGKNFWPEGGAALAVCALSLNLLTPRIATLVRTDMMLSLWIGICGLLILRVVTRGDGWRAGERTVFFAAMLAALLTKGPIIYAFLVPGMAAYAFLGPRGKRHLVWSGWWTWVVPLLVFIAWGVAGILTNEEFYNQVVVQEFFSRFDQSLKSHEKQQPIWFYFPHLLHKFLPWSALVIALPAFSANVRRAVRENPGLLWLVCWALGGLLLMTFIPSKRVDRIFPVVVPLAVLLPGMVAACRCGVRVRAWCGASMLAAAAFSGVYFIGIVVMGYRDGNDALVRFGREAAALAAQSGEGRFAIVGGRDEGLVMYCGLPGTIHRDRAERLWREGYIDALVYPSGKPPAIQNPPAPELESGLRPSGENYHLILREPPLPGDP